MKPIVVHCSAGVGRTGSFCAIDLAIKALQADNKVDVFSTIKHLRTQRMSMVQTPEQYEFVYATVKTYLDMADGGSGESLYQNTTSVRRASLSRSKPSSGKPPSNPPPAPPAVVAMAAEDDLRRPVSSFHGFGGESEDGPWLVACGHAWVNGGRQSHVVRGGVVVMRG